MYLSLSCQLAVCVQQSCVYRCVKGACCFSLIKCWWDHIPPPFFLPSWIYLCVRVFYTALYSQKWCVSKFRFNTDFDTKHWQVTQKAHTHTLLQGFTVSSDKLYNQLWYWLLIGEEMPCQNILMLHITQESLTSLNNIEKLTVSTFDWWQSGSNMNTSLLTSSASSSHDAAVLYCHLLATLLFCHLTWWLYV